MDRAFHDEYRINDYAIEFAQLFAAGTASNP
jgi:hypothetical protein